MFVNSLTTNFKFDFFDKSIKLLALLLQLQRHDR